jgi:hypothetical protein
MEGYIVWSLKMDLQHITKLLPKHSENCEVTFRPSTPGSTRWLCRSTFATNEGKNASIILNVRLRL